MKKFVLEPLKGIGAVNFGDTREQVISVMGTPSIEHESVDYYFDDAIRFDYNEEGNLEFIEFVNNDEYELEIYGVNPFTLKANELQELLNQMNADAIVGKKQAPLSYVFVGISTAIYRDASEQDILVSIEEAKQDGTYEEDKEWLDEELEKYSYFQTIGIGCKDYYTAT